MYCGPQLSYVYCALSILVSHYLIARAALHSGSGRFAESGLQFQEVSLQPNESQHDGMSLFFIHTLMVSTIKDTEPSASL